ncbi:hypothetical protein GT347_14810 [Xylophilus rhododendri]|uniref:ATP-grasp domain-containing protein n=1 Tax=Xylophilus rhododendri TaxID=2697032 RepID=A0A857J8P1_9BURK|nr:hypothetical protein [Xylophilus rhododendri]QHI99145.1 hypothetical protein GT347_14810 [Xylophilus rhododendri]
MRFVRNNFLHHVLAMRAAMQALGGEFLVTGDSVRALVRRGAVHWALHPQFHAEADGVAQYRAAPDEQTVAFAGWLPYRNKRWPAASDKLLFKAEVHKAGLPTPRWSQEAGDAPSPCLVKSTASSFGRGIGGPWAFASVAEQPLQPGQFYEKFVRGESLKIWYLNTQAVAVEREATPTIVGDGRSTLGQLMAERLGLSVRIAADECTAMTQRSLELFALAGRTIDTVLPEGERQAADFRYGSPFLLGRDYKLVSLAREPWFGDGLLQQAGHFFDTLIPAPIRPLTVYTVDAVREQDGRIWFLEMNSNPAVHPLVYGPMLAAMVPGTESQARLLNPQPQHESIN